GPAGEKADRGAEILAGMEAADAAEEGNVAWQPQTETGLVARKGRALGREAVIDPDEPRAVGPWVTGILRGGRLRVDHHGAEQPERPEQRSEPAGPARLDRTRRILVGDHDPDPCQPRGARAQKP